MLAFTFPGQGSQRPGMGRPWADHESWELVDEASEVAGRDVGGLLLDADADELKDTRNAQLTTFVSSLMVLDAVERLGIEPASAPGTASASTRRSPPPARSPSTTACASCPSGPRRCTRPGADKPGTMAAVLGLDDDEVEVACRRADADVWVANFNAPGQVVIAGSRRGRRSGQRARQGARRQEGHAAAGVGAFHTPYMAAARDRLRKAIAEADLRDTDVPVVSNVDASPTTGAASGRPAVRPALQPGALEAVPADARRARRHRVRRARPRRRAHRHGQAQRRRRPHDLGLHARGARQAARVGRRRHRGRRCTLEGEHLFAVERLVVSPAAGIFTPIALESTARRSRSARCSATSASTRCARRSRRAAELHRRRHANGSRPANHRLAAVRADTITSPGASDASNTSRYQGGVITGWGPPSRRRCSPTTTCRDDGHERRVDRRAHRHPRTSHRRHHGRAVGRVGPQGAGDGRARSRRDRRAGAGDDHARPQCPATPPRSRTSSACAAARSTSTPPARASCTGSSRPRHDRDGRRPGTGDRHRHTVAHHRLGRPRHAPPVRRRLGRGVLESVDGPGQLLGWDLDADGSPLSILLGRGRRLHPDGGQGGLPAGGADHGRLGREVDGARRRHRRRHRA